MFPHGEQPIYRRYMITITYSAFYTRNLGDYQNAKIGYEITTDEKRDGESLEDFRDRIKAKVQQWIVEDIREIDEESGSTATVNRRK